MAHTTEIVSTLESSDDQWTQVSQVDTPSPANRNGLRVDLLAIAFFLTLITVLLFAVLGNTHGRFIYVLDDPYISAAMAKNFVQHGILGITRYGFTSSSSSIIWPFLVALTDVLLGVHSINPFIINIVLGIVLIALCRKVLAKIEPRAGPAYTFACLSAIILFTPLTGLAFVGLEHTLHTVVTIGIAYVSSCSLSKEEDSRDGGRILWGKLAPLSLLVTASRYEGIFVITVIAGLFVLRQRWRQALTVLLAGCAPIILFGLCSKIAGWCFLPNPVLLKGGQLSEMARGLLYFPYTTKLHYPSDVRVIFLIGTILFLGGNWAGTRIWDQRQLLLLIFIFTTLLHMQFAALGWFFRYEAYLMALGTLSVAGALYQILEGARSAKSKKAFLACTSIVFLAVSQGSLLEPRSLGMFSRVPRAAKNIFEQQYQMAQFIKRDYSGATVALNDVGAVNYFADIHCVDLYGLGSVEVARAKLAHSLTSASLENIVRNHGGKIAIVYEEWYRPYGGVPKEWIRVGSWKITDNIVGGGDTVSFYATDVSQTELLTANLRQFSDQLPTSVEQRGSYVRPAK